jgi:hypothetical protein
LSGDLAWLGSEVERLRGKFGLFVLRANVCESVGWDGGAVGAKEVFWCMCRPVRGEEDGMDEVDGGVEDDENVASAAGHKRASVEPDPLVEKRSRGNETRDAGAGKRVEMVVEAGGEGGGEEAARTEKDLKRLTCDQLRVELGDRGLAKTGRKSELIARLLQYLETARRERRERAAASASAVADAGGGEQVVGGVDGVGNGGGEWVADAGDALEEAEARDAADFFDETQDHRKADVVDAVPMSALKEEGEGGGRKVLVVEEEKGAMVVDTFDEEEQKDQGAQEVEAVQEGEEEGEAVDAVDELERNVKGSEEETQGGMEEAIHEEAVGVEAAPVVTGDVMAADAAALDRALEEEIEREAARLRAEAQLRARERQKHVEPSSSPALPHASSSASSSSPALPPASSSASSSSPAHAMDVDGAGPPSMHADAVSAAALSPVSEKPPAAPTASELSIAASGTAPAVSA